MQSYHETKAGTKIPLRNIRGNLYMDVTWRVVWMREEHPDWQIHTNIVHADDKGTLCRAVVINSDGKTIATGHRYQDKSFAQHVEKSESQAIGRALAIAGYGTAHALADFDDGTDDPSQLPDSAIPPPSKPVIQLSPQHVSNNPGSYQVTFGKFKGKTLTEIGIEQATSYAEYLSRSDKPSQQSTAFIDAVDNWARSLAPKTESQGSIAEIPPDWVSEDIPLNL